MAASRRLRDLQSQPGNKICVDCSQKTPSGLPYLMAFLCASSAPENTADSASTSPSSDP
ncbi:UNVERIFIED_CONTAM: hypothetical protein Slati_1673500 [Sesamum latifolium]|uniref:Uncharacterized protein n=1 Tax=Sesamum latifolium TaxID=2727402 RepID=A0AAW2XDT1_9LAMI